MEEAFNFYEGVQLENGKAIGICEFYEELRKNIETFCDFLSKTEKGEGTLISSTRIEGEINDIILITEIEEVTGLTPYSTIIYRGEVSIDKIEGIKLSYTPASYWTKSWYTIDVMIPPSDTASLLASPKKFDEIDKEELEAFEKKLGIENGMLKILQEDYKKKKKFIEFDSKRSFI